MSGLPRLTIAARDRAPGDSLAAGCFEDRELDLRGLDRGLAGSLSGLHQRAGWKGREDQRLATLHGNLAVSLGGLGKAGDLTPQRLVRWLTETVDLARTNGAEHLSILLPHHPQTLGRAAISRVLRAVPLAAYRFDHYRSPGRDGKTPRGRGRLGEISVIPPRGEEDAYRREASTAIAVAEGVALARDLGNTPASDAHPGWIEDRARALAADAGLEITVLEGDELAERGMGGLLAVGRGSPHPPRLVRLDWKAPAAGEDTPTLAVVGKGVTFDTGGISLKPPTGMDEMKFDKCGACAAIALAHTVASLDLPIHLKVYAPLAENMPDGRSYRPGDIVRCYNGKTVEIIDTDAEGRMILADALAWAVDEKPDALLEMSTLTGACVIALGYEAAGLYTPDDALAAELQAASIASGERLWRLPLWPEHVEQMKGVHADLKNAGPRWGGANTAAAFLSQFVGDLKRWAHLDIAGVAHVGHDQEEHPGATGYGVSLATEWIRASIPG
ncbi:MAG: leucyl aminopeptidase family protein [Acidobacteriota bacterium]